ncbi:sigma 54-interacting transcriptional regulator [Pedobacter miscanthi]|uniref:Sigma-54-dependent Fis family transcriptional regulator n=1 Tax=Pedobacter miscanthi TaxID=2259170 RepID=A0A366LDB8_9SPHI|nr:sigma 54-interacting transcriptional regulator [Pedobacter miscanthi]RBQ11871.1 sigma-54-dependent Fis family transcriptional regulator [Pedobacter miscanthi]
MAKKVLIVEDEYVVANNLRLILSKAGYSIIGIAISVEDALEQMHKQKPDIVLLDIMLNGERSGIDLAKILTAQHIAFVYLSANSNQTILEEAKKTDPYGFLVKPFREKDLIVTLDIAWYRQKNNVEARLLQEVSLQKQLLDISNRKSEAKQKLLEISQAIRIFIPFDLIVTRADSDSGYVNCGYLRTGFSEYEFIVETELVASVNPKQSLSRKTFSTDNGPAFFSHPNQESEINRNSKIPGERVWMNYFKMESERIFRLKIGTGTEFSYIFYSRQRDLYTQKHTEVLRLFTKCLSNVTEKMLYPSISSLNRSLGEPLYNKSKLLERREFNGIIGSHSLLLAALDLTIQVAPYNTSVLILGESGTGKEKIARAVHQLSSRRDKPFIQVNCGAIPSTLIESELFGHVLGAFTGATEKRKGKFELASGGTIFLDEIGELPLDMQVKLLRVLQEKEVNAVGGNSPFKVDVRVVAATNRNLEKAVAEGKFRLDLYYRLNIFPITIAPLRERKSDIPALVNFFVNKFCKEFNKPIPDIEGAMMDQLYGYQWPGNIRELENIIERSVIINEDSSKLNLKQPLTEILVGNSPISAIETLDDVKQIQMETERAHLISVLTISKGRIRGQNGAAELLKIKPTTLESKLLKLNIRRQDYFPSQEP